MGLDMYLCKAKRPEYPCDEEFITEEWLEKRGLRCFRKEAVDEPIRELLPYCKEDAVMVEMINARQIIIDNGWNPDNCEICLTHMSNSRIGYRIYTEKTVLKEFEITFDELDTKYVYETLEDVYVVDLKEVAYWRNEDNLRHYIYDIFDNDVGNCKYKKLDMDQVFQILTYDKGDQEELEIEEETEDCAYFYMEWY